MSKYYESEALIEFLETYVPHVNGETTLKCVERAILEAPTVDAVPRKEFENYKQIAEKQQKLSLDRYFEIKKLKKQIEKSKLAVAEAIFGDIDKLLEEYSSGVIGYAEFASGIAMLKENCTLERNCTTCEHMVCCEPNPFGVCEDYKKKQKIY